jgi:hypothetical protein
MSSFFKLSITNSRSIQKRRTVKMGRGASPLMLESRSNTSIMPYPFRACKLAALLLAQVRHFALQRAMIT